MKRVEEPTRHGAAAGLVLGLAIGAAVALFPAAGIPLAAGMFGGGALGTMFGAVAGHVARGMKRSDLKELGELLDDGSSGLVVVAASDVEAKVEAAITKAKSAQKPGYRPTLTRSRRRSTALLRRQLKNEFEAR